jgi:hypothetical protein
VDEGTLERLLQRVLMNCVAAPAILGSLGCGWATTPATGADASAPSDAATADTATADGAPMDGAPMNEDAGGCGAVACGGCSCGPGCLQITVCVDGAPQFGCNCDAGIDAGLSCSPDRTSCSFYLPFGCLDGGLPADGGMDTPAQCQALCGATDVNVCYPVTASGGVTVLACACGLAGGRRPEGFRPRRARRRSGPLGTYFASVAQLEAASVGAFRTLAEELAAYGAPAHLSAAAQRAARDEVRHARTMGRLARSHGAVVPRLERRARRARSLEEIAVENAVEGCVRETFGALTAAMQARSARDPRVREAMQRIAADETRHASLGWAVASWAHSRLDAAARARVDAARTAAVVELSAEMQAEPAEDLVRTAGVPSARQAQRMIAEMERELWSAA